MKMISTNTLRNLFVLQRAVNNPRLVNFSSQVNIEKLEREQTDIEVADEEQAQREAEIEIKRNKSRLKDQDRNRLHGKNPYPEPTFWHHGTLKYLRATYGKYGQASGVDPSICWPTKQELDDIIEYEKFAFPKTIPQMVEEAKLARHQKEEAILERQKSVSAKVAKLEQWKNELYAKIAKKEAEANEAKQRRERLIEEVRRHFGYKVEPHEDKFKEMLEKKEKEQRKAMREARKKAKEEKLSAKLLKEQELKKAAAESTETDTDATVDMLSEKEEKKQKDS